MAELAGQVLLGDLLFLLSKENSINFALNVVKQEQHTQIPGNT